MTGARGAIAALTLIATIAGGNSATAAHRSEATPAGCTSGQLKLSGRLSGATQSLLGALSLENRSGHACGLPIAPRRVSLMIGRRVLPTLTVRWTGSSPPRGTPTLRLPAHGRVTVGVQWRNWCGAPRGTVRVALVLTLVGRVAVTTALGPTATPPCVAVRYSSRIAVTRFLA
jgi:hypothetical protein